MGYIKVINFKPFRAILSIRIRVGISQRYQYGGMFFNQLLSDANKDLIHQLLRERELALQLGGLTGVRLSNATVLENGDAGSLVGRCFSSMKPSIQLSAYTSTADFADSSADISVSFLVDGDWTQEEPFFSSQSR